MRLDLSEAERELFDERAAILEYVAGWPRPIAESDAFRAPAQAQRRVRARRLVSERYGFLRMRRPKRFRKTIAECP
jgi:hypothetical protein